MPTLQADGCVPTSRAFLRLVLDVQQMHQQYAQSASKFAPFALSQISYLIR